ncbi:MAG TPA: M23 family metallopeptidase [Polyangia bacterium]|jgi:murein DD-endopeptidase MepM/ murein hydrolase activator NlpD|nr:M23 family metallopeptidase [Polyangia bacterium]
MRSFENRRGPAPLAAASGLGLLAVFAVLIAFNVYFFFYRRGTSLPQLQAAVRQDASPKPRAGAPSAAAAKRPLPARRPPDPVVEPLPEGTTGGGEFGPADTLEAVLRREGASPRTATEVIAALRKYVDPRTLRQGQRYLARRDSEERLRAFEYRPIDKDKAGAAVGYRVERRGETWRAFRVPGPIETAVVDVAGTITTNLYDAALQGGEGPALASLLVDVFAWDLNFYLDPRPGDRFRLRVEKHSVQGRFHQLGRVLAAEYVGRGGTYRVFYYRPQHGEPGYYTQTGEAVARSLLGTPLKYARLPQGFDPRRLLPVAHSEDARPGVDYAAPAGTPVWAIAGGKVSFRGAAAGGAGQTVVITHPGGMESVYTHLGRLARGLEVGDTVRPRQVIGYLGAGGQPPPPLHFAVKLGDHFVDPVRLRPARSAPLPPSERERFAQAIAAQVTALDRSPPEHATAEIHE